MCLTEPEKAQQQENPSIGRNLQEKQSKTIHRNDKKSRRTNNEKNPKEILDTTKIIKSQRQPKNLKRILTTSTFGENTTQGIPNAIRYDVEYVM